MNEAEQALYAIEMAKLARDRRRQREDEFGVRHSVRSYDIRVDDYQRLKDVIYDNFISLDDFLEATGWSIAFYKNRMVASSNLQFTPDELKKISDVTKCDLANLVWLYVEKSTKKSGKYTHTTNEIKALYKKHAQKVKKRRQRK